MVPLFELALRHSPAYAKAAYFLGRGELRLGRSKQGRAHLEHFLQIAQPDDPRRPLARQALAAPE